ncbi:DUF6030 family protein [Hansschlegelia zhihuaiae]|uniref:Uncharacterized protein n=1 Tax=Hansschlegelia zhihuaiae TaxID=405005 RepID=A0A4Q0M5Z4_9HYPH|nr:DUF6030 family protein [Hansschlegelia zhihuaiae]RXF68458.1 hypothetical protein EK403_19915 [Hansschlegelia zhihuaiae]
MTLACAAAAAVLIAAAVAVHLAKPAWLFGAPAPPPKPQARPADPLGALPPGLVARLVWPLPDAPSPFMRITRVRPKAFCDSLAAAGLRNAAFQMGEAPLKGWTCVTDLIKPVEGDEQSVSSLFVATRGLESDRIDNVRMKLNLIDPGTAPVVKAIARDVLRQICRSLGWEPPAAVVEAIDGPKEGRVLERGVSYDLKREFGPAERFNLIIVFPRSLGQGGEDRFVADPRRSAVAR